MNWILAIPVLLLPMLGNFPAPQLEDCSCPAITSVSVSTRSSGSIGWTWSGSESATGYEVWFHKEDGDYTSAHYNTTNESYTYSGLAPGRYTFYFRAVCGGQISSFIGVEDIVEN